MTRERKSLIAGVGVLIFTVILAGVAVPPSAGAVTFTATPLPGQEPPTSLITQPTLFIDDSGMKQVVYWGGP